MLTNIHQYLVANADTWGSSDTRAICVLGDFIVSLYDQPLDVVDLTGEDEDQPGDANNDSGLAWSTWQQLSNYIFYMKYAIVKFPVWTINHIPIYTTTKMIELIWSKKIV